jgi:hypothetical protein
MAKFNIFTEKQVRESILKKGSLSNINKNGGHWTADIECAGKVMSFIKIPNPHKNEFWENKAKKTADQLMLSPKQYNEFVKCNMKPKEYLQIICPEEEEK